MRLRPRSWIVCGLLVASGLPVAAQSRNRVATSVPLLATNAVFYNNRTIAVAGIPTEVDGFWHLSVPAPKTLLVLWRSEAPPAGTVEIHGIFLDVGRFAPDDSRLSDWGVTPVVRLLSRDHWPARDTFYVIAQATATVAPDESDHSMRAIVLQPLLFEHQTVTVRGRFRGQNLLGDEPTWPRQSKWDFVLQSADAAIWVTGIRPKGHDFDFDPSSRRDTDRWLEATGTLEIADGMPYVAAQSVKTTPPVDDTGPPEAADLTPPAPPAPAPEVVFSVPTDGDIDIPAGSTVQIQFSRPIREASFAGHIQVRYGAGATEQTPAFKTAYHAATRSVELTFTSPLPPLTHVTVQLTAGIVSVDNQPLAPTTITFTTGG